MDKTNKESSEKKKSLWDTVTEAVTLGIVFACAIFLFCYCMKQYETEKEEKRIIEAVTPESVTQAMEASSTYDAGQWFKAYLAEHGSEMEQGYKDLCVTVPVESEKSIDDDTFTFTALFDTQYRDDCFIYGKEVVYTVHKDMTQNKYIVDTKVKRLGSEDDYTDGKTYQILFTDDLRDFKLATDIG